MFRSVAVLGAASLSLVACQDQASMAGAGRDRISVVGSSTVYPFTTLVAEQFVAANPGIPAPVIESTGTGGGMNLFCKGLGGRYPDIADASRRMKASEYRTCAANGAGELMEIEIGLDGVAFAEANNGPKLQLTPIDIYRALAAEPDGKPNRSRTWRDVDPALPAIAIQVYGPPSTSGTRDAVAELILARGCVEAMPQMAAVRETRPEAFAHACTRVRDDGPYIDAGENDNLIVQKLQANPDTIGIFGYSYLEENKDRLNGVPLNGIEPTYETIASGQYPGSRPLFLYVKKAHLSAIPNLKSFLAAYAQAWNPDGPLVRRGLIAAPADIRARSLAIVRNQALLDPQVLN